MTIMRSSNSLSATARRAAAAALILGVAACSDDADSAPAVDTAAAAPAPAIVIDSQDLAAARIENIGATITLSGPLEPKDQVILRAQVPGTVANLRVDRGSNVSRGQRLATIRAAGVQSQAAGALAGVAAAEANLAVARQRLEAARQLREAGAISDIDLRSAQAGFEAASAQVAAARAQSASAGEAAGYTVITAPISGTVSSRKVQEGEAVNPGGELLTIVNSRVLQLAGQISVADAARVRVGQPVTFSLDAAPGQGYRGRVARIDPTADPGTRQVGVFVELQNPGGRIIGGQFARGSIATTSTRALVVPLTAVRGATPDNVAEAHVFVVENGRIVRRPVQVGARDEASGRIAIVNGVREGEKVIVNPTSDIVEGTIVTVAGSAGPAPAPAAAKE
jgi:RND family efflux transporter MFP subunit